MSFEADMDMEEERGGRFSLERILSAVHQRAALVAAVAVTIAGLAAAVVFLMPNRYDAIAVVQIDPRHKTISNLEGVVSGLAPTSATVDSEVEVVRSTTIALKVIDTLGLRSDPEFAGKKTAAAGRDATGSGDDAIGRLIGGEPPVPAASESDAVLNAFLGKLKVNRVRVTLLIEIRYSSADPAKAARIANAIAQAYLNEQIDEKRRATNFASGLLEEKIAGLKIKVADAERRVEQFKAEHGIHEAEGGDLSDRQLAQQMTQTTTAGTASATARAKYEQVQKLILSGEGSASVAEVLNSGSIGSLKSALAAATRREAELETRYGPKHPELQKVRAEVSDAAAQLNQEVQRVVANLKTEYELAETTERGQMQNLAALKQQQNVSKDASITLKALQREASTEKQLFEALLARYKQTAETENLQLPDSRIVEQASVPAHPAWPKRKQIVLIALFAGLLAGLALALALEFFTSGITHVDDIEHTLELSHLSSVPAIAAANRTTADALRALRMILAEPRGVFTEAIRGARREIDARSRPGVPRLILVASSLPTEDAETIASNLAHHYTLSGSRVLLVDGDLRRASLTRRLVPSPKAGLLDVLTRDLDFEKAVLRDATTGLNFLPAMSDDPLQVCNPELLASARMAAVFTFMKRQFDTIIVSAPPLLPVVDGRLLADHADQIVFVMAWRRTPKQLAKRALKTLGLSQRKIAGVVMNQVDTRDSASAGNYVSEPVLSPPRRVAQS